MYVVCVEKVEGKSATALQRGGGGGGGSLTADRTPHQTSRRLERRKLQRNRTAFTPTQIDQLEQGAPHSLSHSSCLIISTGAPIMLWPIIGRPIIGAK